MLKTKTINSILHTHSFIHHIRVPYICK